MNFFTVNQVNQVYVVKSVGTVNSEANVGTVEVKTDLDGCLFFKHMGPGGVTRSDLIDPKEILWARMTPAEAMRRKLTKYEITLPSAINSGLPVVGEDYIVNIEFTGYIGISPEDSKYLKFGAVHATSIATSTASDFYKMLAISIANNFSREAVKMIKIAVVISGNEVEVTPGMKIDDAALNGLTATKVVLTALESDWILGTKQERPMNFRLSQPHIMYDGEEVEGLLLDDVTAETGDNYIPNGKDMADYEYFFHGERGDQYRLVSFPEFIPTTYLVDPTKEYDTVAIHFAYVGDNQSCLRSEKDITFLIDSSLNITDSFVSDIEDAANITIKNLYAESKVPGRP